MSIWHNHRECTTLIIRIIYVVYTRLFMGSNKLPSLGTMSCALSCSLSTLLHLVQTRLSLSTLAALHLSTSWSMLMIDESKTHLILSPFFINILRLNVQLKCQIMEYSPKSVFCRILEKKQEAKKQEKTTNFAKARSGYCFDKTKNCCNKEMSKWPQDYCNNKFSIATKNQ